MWSKTPTKKVYSQARGLRGFSTNVPLEQEINDARYIHSPNNALPDNTSAFRKRPVKITYSRLDYFRHYAPSEKQLLYSCKCSYQLI